MRIVAAFLMSIFIMSCSSDDEVDGTVKIYYVPIGVATYVPVTEENITESYVECVEKTDADRDVKKLLNILTDAKDGDFDGDIVRAKIVLSGGGTIYVDNEGGIKLAGRTAKLSSSNISRVKDLFEEITELR